MTRISVTPRPNMAALLSSLYFARLLTRRRARGSAGGGRRLARRRSRLNLRDLLRLRLVDCLLESFDGFSEAFTQLGELTGPEHDEDDDQDQKQLPPAKSKHLIHLFFGSDSSVQRNRVNFRIFPITWAGC